MKLLIGFVAHILTVFGGADDHSQLRMVCLWGLAEWIHVLDGADRWLDDDQRQRWNFAAEAYLLAYGRLRAEAVASDR